MLKILNATNTTGEENCESSWIQVSLKKTKQIEVYYLVNSFLTEANQ
jgi:hypothetical protein